jgi:hypothetical protein
VQVSVDAAVAALDPDRWEFAVADNRPRADAGRNALEQKTTG